MPNNKKKSSKKKKGKQSVSVGAGSSDAAAESPNIIQIDITGERGSIESAASYAALFARDYPPKIDIDNYFASLSKKANRTVDHAYEMCSKNFNRGIHQMQTMSDTPRRIADGTSPSRHSWTPLIPP